MIKPKSDKELFNEVLIEIKVKDHDVESYSLMVCKAFHEKKLKNELKQLKLKV